MTCCCCIPILALIVVIAICLYKKIMSTFYTYPPIPDLQRDKYWGPGSKPENEDTSIRPFKIEFKTDMIADLKSRLSNTRYTEPLEDVGFIYGFNNNGLKPLIDFWKDEYDFNAREKFFNKFPHFKTNIQGLDIHYMHIKPNADNKMKTAPMLMMHGWPGSIREFYEIINLLTTSDHRIDFKFELIIPSLPGFAFSQAASKRGLGVAEIGVVMSNLMARLGHNKYYIQGGDWGSIIGSCMSTLFPDEVLGYHTNMPVVNTPLSNLKMIIGSFRPSLFIEKQFEKRMYPMKSRFMTLLVETGYFHIQATKPDTLGVGLNNSPAGIAAWIVEKFAGSSTEEHKLLPDGGLLNNFTYEEMIDNVMMYWVNNAATTSARIYAESFNTTEMALGLERIPTPVPTAIARFPKEINFNTKFQLQEKYPNIVLITDFPRGGHFAALQVPELLAEDIKTAMLRFEEFHRSKK